MKTASKIDFSDWLVASDVDGTLNTKLRTLPGRNLEAITRFVQQLGGNFTLASGRNVESLRKHYNKLPISPIPAIILNGAGIYDYSLEKMLSFHAIDETGRDFVRHISEKYPMLEIEVCTDDMIYLLHPRVFGSAMTMADKLPHVKCKRFEEIPPHNWGKVIFMGLPSSIASFTKYINSIENPHASFMSSSMVSHEMLAQNVNKGAAVFELADLLGIPHGNTAAIGDYFNDYEMLKSVAVSAACAQAPKRVRAAAAFTACHCNMGAVADFLEYIENNCQ